MLTLLSLQKTIVLRAFTATPRLAEILPPIAVAECPPQWWKGLKPETHLVNPRSAKSSIPTIKRCYALQHLFGRAIGLRLWQDINIAVPQDAAIIAEGVSRHVPSVGMSHPAFQFAGAFAPTLRHYKLHSPWLFVCDRASHFAWMSAFYHRIDPSAFHVMPGVVEFRYQHGTHINLLINTAGNERIELSLSAGDMMVYLLPVEASPVKIIAEEISESEMERIEFGRNVTHGHGRFARRFSVSPYRA